MLPARYFRKTNIRIIKKIKTRKQKNLLQIILVTLTNDWIKLPTTIIIKLFKCGRLVPLYCIIMPQNFHVQNVSLQLRNFNLSII